MASSKVLMFSIFFALVIAGTRAVEEAGPVNVDISRSESFDSAVKLEIEQLKIKISSLESAMSEKARDLKCKDEKISQLESVIQEKETSILSLQKKVELLQKKGAVDAVELVGKVYARSNQLEKKVEELKNEIDMQKRKRHALEAKTIESDKEVQELDHKLHVVHRAWLPPWLAYLIVRYQEIGTANWKEHEKPSLGVLLLKVSEKSGQAQKWIEPHLETAKTKWIAAAKARWIAFTATVRPHMEEASTKAFEMLEFCRTTAKPHIFALQEFANRFVHEARTFVKPHVELAATITKPYVDKASAALKPYAATVVYGYTKLLETTGTYHHQAQDIVTEHLKKHDLTKPLATKEFVWFAASASLALPIFLIYKMLSQFFGKKVVKSVRSTRSHNSHRRHK